MVAGLGLKAVKVIGILVILVSIFMTWITMTVFGAVISLNIPDMLNPSSTSPTAVLLQRLAAVALVFMIAGIVVAVVWTRRSGLGGLIALIGPLAFAIGFEVYADPGVRAVADFGIGFYAAIIGAVILSFQILEGRLA